MKLTILYDNTTTNPNLTADWGFSCYIETGQHKIIFDTGQNGAILRQNMQRLKIDPQKADLIFVSHNDFDHIGGLSWLLNNNSQAALYLPNNLRGIINRKKVFYVKEATKLAPNIYSTGILAGDGKWEQAMVLKNSKGAVIIVGCSHPKLKPFIEFAKSIAKPYAIIGGFHGFSSFSDLKDLQLICPTHCTQHRKEIEKIYPDTTITGGVGKVVEI